MDPISTDFSPAGLTSAIEQNYLAWLPILARLGQYCEDTPPGVRRVLSEYKDSFFNAVLDARLTSEGADAAIETVLADLRARQVPAWWWVGPSTQPADLGARLLAHGFALEEETPAMALDLERLTADLPCPEGLTVEPGVEFFSENPHPVELAWHQLYDAETAVMHPYRGLIDGKQVAGAMYLEAAGAAGIYAVWVNKEYRRRGIGSYVTLQALRDARRKGYRVATLQSSKMGYSVYRALGFEEYFKVGVYIWKPEKEGAK